MPVTALPRYCGRSDSCSLQFFGGLFPQHELWLVLSWTGLPDSRTRPSHHSVSNHPACLPCRFCTLPLSSKDFPGLAPGSGVHPSLGGLPVHDVRIEFVVILRTGSSPSVAPHPILRWRNYSQLQAGERMPEEDLHLSGHARFQAH